MDDNDRQEGMENTSEDQAQPQPMPETPERKRIEVTDDFADPGVAEFDDSETEEFKVAPQDEDIEEASVPTLMNEAIVDTEIEPETSASMNGQASATTPETPPSSQSLEADRSRDLPASAPSMGLSTAKQRSNKRMAIMIVVGALLLAVVGGILWWLLAGKKDTTNNRADDTSSTPIEQPKLGVVVTVADGTVEYKRGADEWKLVDTSTQLKEGDFVRTGEDSRAVITVDDGSAIRLGATTTVELVSLAANKIEVKQVDGIVYSRIVPSDRKYIVSLDGSTYEALGTAFATSRDFTRSGVQVFQSSVRVSDITEVVKEGQQLYRPFGDFMGPLKVTDIDIDLLADDTFISWNLSEDEKDDSFKERLGVLPKIKQRGEEVKKERQAEEAKKKAEKEAAEKSAKEKQEAEDKNRQNAAAGTKVTRGDMALSLAGDNTLRWNYTGKAVYGYKLVYSKSNAMPTVGTDDSVYYAGIHETSGSLPKKDKIGGGKYRVRVCAYTNNTEDDACIDYSNIVYINL